jgi:hypothetical protein
MERRDVSVRALIHDILRAVAHDDLGAAVLDSDVQSGDAE